MPDLGGIAGNGDEPDARTAGWAIKKEAEEEKKRKRR